VVLRFVQALVCGNLPYLPRLLDAHLLPLAKPNGRGVRLIAMGEVWYRLASLCTLAACPNAGRSLPPLQFAAGISGGSKIMHAGMAADPGCITVQVDWQNAFNTVRRDRVVAAVAQRCPALLPMVPLAYGLHSRLLVQHTKEVVRSQSGVRQGPLLFAWTLQRCPALLPMVPLAYGLHSRLLVQHTKEVVRSQSGVRQEPRSRWQKWVWSAQTHSWMKPFSRVPRQLP
jgi:hypothetical protein